MPLDRRTFFAALFLCAPLARGAGGSYNVQDYGAVPDGRTLDTAAFARAVAACAAGGGGTLLVPPGHYLTGSVRLFSNMTLMLDAGSELLYSPRPEDSPLVASRWESTTAFIHAPLIYAADAQNIAIMGRGILNGQGRFWWWRSGKGKDRSRAAEIEPAKRAWLALYDRIEGGYRPVAADFALAAQYLRPNLVLFNGCRNVLVEGITVTESPMWHIHPLYCEDVSIRGVTIISTGVNGDGIDIDSSRDVRIADCFFNTGDDCIVIKSGRNADGRRINRPAEHITVENCVMYRGHGAIAIGSETSGGIRDVMASNIVSRGTDYGIRIKSERGRGNVIENLRFENFVIDQPKIEAIEITAYYENQPTEPFSSRTPIFRNIAFGSMTITDAAHVANIRGLPEKDLEQLRFTDISATGVTGLVCERASDVELHQVRITVQKGSAYSFSHVSGLSLDGVTAPGQPQGQPAIKLQETAFAPGDLQLSADNRH